MSRLMAIPTTEMAGHRAFWDGLPKDPVFDFRLATQDRYLFTPKEQQFIHLQPSPFTLDATQNELLEDTPRQFGEASGDFLVSDMAQTIFKMMGEMTTQHRHLPAVPGATPEDDRILISLHQFRIMYEPDLEPVADVIPEAADVTPEGVHQDGAEQVLVMLMGKTNIQSSSATSRIFSLEQPLGPVADEKTPDELFAVELDAPGDSLFLADRLCKHAVTPVVPKDPSLPACRDVIVAWSRRPKCSDSLAPHESSLLPSFSA